MKKWIAIMVAGLAGCATEKDHNNLKVRFESTVAKMAELETKISSLEASLEMTDQMVANKLDVDAYRVARLTPDDPGYSRLDSETSSFLVSLQSVKAHADGVQVVFAFGNPYAIRFKGFRLTANWAAKFPKTVGLTAEERRAVLKKWEATKGEKTDINVATDLASGKWNTVMLTLAPARLEDFGYVDLSALQTNTIALLK